MNEKTREQVEEDRDDLAFMQHPEWWPQGFYLPLKRRARHGYETAVLMAWDTDIYLLWENKTMFDGLGEDDAEQVIIEELPTILARGWVVD